MIGDLDAAGMDGMLRARRVAMTAALLEQARGQRPWHWYVWGGVLAAALAGFAAWAKPTVETCVGFMLLCGIAGWSESLLARRIDAVVRLLEQQAQNG